MRIGVDIREFVADRRTGIGSYLEGFLLYAIHAHPGHTYFLYGNQQTRFSLAHEKVTIRCPREPFPLWWDQVVLPRSLRADRVDCFFSPYYKAPLLGPGVRVITIHDLIFMRLPEYGTLRHRAYSLAFRVWASLIATRVARILTDSESSRRDILQELKVPEEKVLALPLSLREGMAPVEEETRLAEVRQRHGIQGTYLLTVGNMKPHKNVSILLDMYARLSPEIRASCQLVLAGGGTTGVPSTEEIARQGLAGRVVRTGSVPDGEMAALYSGATLFLFPSLYEGFGLPALEAMACGTPVVASNASSIPEVVGRAGVLLDPRRPDLWAASVQELLEDGDRREALRAAGLLQAGAFTPERCYGALFKVLEEAAGG